MQAPVTTTALAKQINAEHGKVEQPLKSVVDHATRAGELLIEAIAVLRISIYVWGRYEQR